MAPGAGRISRLPREGWLRKAAWLDPSVTEIAALLRPVIGDAPIVSAKRVSGGLVNSNLRVTLRDPPGVLLLRLFQRDPPTAHKEAAIDRLLCNHVPRPRFLHFAASNPVTGTPYAVLEWIDGKQLGATLNTDAMTLEAIGGEIGAVLAQVHSFRFDRAGFFTPDMRVPTAIDLDREALLGFMQHCFRDGPGGERLGAALTDRLFAFVEREGNRLDGWLGDPRLTHADFNPSNILMHDQRTAWRVAAVLDWEFALSATPAFDFGNLLRPPLGECAAFVSGLVRGYRAAGGFLPVDWLRIAQIADLFAWTDLLGRGSDDPVLAADARRIVAATIDAG
ncbi:MAG TPA: aminoglycoside phosphotransferase family protein [Acetobacteraceae bacterium]|nr:aminoglycoside phosphotransferase family protein [Acetobacteraceae bacterium]